MWQKIKIRLFIRALKKWVFAPRDLYYFAKLFLGSRPVVERDRNKFDLSDGVFSMYINLDKRADRREQFEGELLKMGFLLTKRFSAVELAPGLLGCNESHISVLSLARDSGLPCLIFEDDAVLDGSEADLRETIEEFLSDRRLDVLNLAPTRYGITLPWSTRLRIANNVRAVAAYCVKPAAIPRLIASFGEAAGNLRAGSTSASAAFDAHWAHLQRKELRFCVPAKRLIYQRPSFSDVLQRHVSY